MALVNNTQVITNDNWSIIKTNAVPDDILLPTVTLAEIIIQGNNNNGSKVLQPTLDVILPIDALINMQGLATETLSLIKTGVNKVGAWINIEHSYKIPDIANTAQLNGLLAAHKGDNITIDIIVLYVTGFVYGRAFSLAKHLRLEGYDGEIRLAGDFGRDQLTYYERSGINSYMLIDEKLDADYFDSFNDLATSGDAQSVAKLPMFLDM